MYKFFSRPSLALTIIATDFNRNIIHILPGLAEHHTIMEENKDGIDNHILRELVPELHVALDATVIRSNVSFEVRLVFMVIG